jgi:hypothetical protein
MDSKPMPWSELRERVAQLPYSDHAALISVLNRLLDNIDAAAEAMREQERDAGRFRAERNAYAAFRQLQKELDEND